MFHVWFLVMGAFIPGGFGLYPIVCMVADDEPWVAPVSATWGAPSSEVVAPEPPGVGFGLQMKAPWMVPVSVAPCSLFRGGSMSYLFGDSLA